MKKTNNGELRLQDIGKTITLYGFVANKRKMGSILFVDLRDSWGITQVVVSKDLKVTLTKESVIEVTGIVSKRKEKNPALLTGDIEVVATKITVLSLANQLPFIIHDKLEAHDETRFLHRFLDLRRPVMQKRFFLRHKINTWIREFLTSQKFLEIETPYLSKATPEGARDFLVPTRKKNKFFALPQSPQLYKQLLMASGFEKYFQIVRAFRDEDTRKDRQPEFTQLDIECAYAEPQDIKNLVEKLFQYLWTKLNFKVKIPFATMTYKHALDTYGTDKPDLRYNLELVNSRSLGPNLPFQVFAKETIIKHIFLQQTLTSSQIKELVEITQKNKKPDFLWASCLKDKKLEGSAVKVFPEELKNIFQKLDFQLGTLLFCVGSANAVNQSLGAIRVKLNQMFSLAKEEFNFVWIEDWPLFEEDTTNKIITPLHHLFTAPRSNDLHLLDQNPLKVKSEAYDLVLNGCEIGGGSKRINSRILQEKMFQLAGLSSKEVKTQFGFFLKAFNFGFPPHAGIAFGLDRLLMLLTNAKSIREVIAFPKNVKGYGVLEETPSTILE